MGWYRRSSRLLFDVFRGYSPRFEASKNIFRESVSIKNFQASSLKKPSFSKSRVSETWQSHSSLRNEIKKNQHHSPLWDVAKRFYYVDRQQIHHFKPRGYKRWLQNPRNVFMVVVVSSGVVISVYFGNLETVPYTKRTHFVLLSRALEIQLGEAQFQEMKKQFKGRILPPLHPNSIRVLNVAHDIIEALQKGLRNDQVWSDTRYSPEIGVLRQGGAHAHGTAKALSDKLADNDKWQSGDKWHKEDEVLDDKWVQQSRKKGKDKGVASQHLQGLNWEVVVVNDPLVNAICFPGGKIIVFTGLLEHFRADAEIATIVGHEVSHAVARHSAEQISKNLWLTIFQLILCMFVAPDIVNTMSNLLLRLPFSRRMEMEADYIGLLLMASAGYDPRVAPQVYEKLGRVVGDSPLQDYLATHPSGKKRAQLLARAKVMEEALGIYREAVAGRAVEGFL